MVCGVVRKGRKNITDDEVVLLGKERTSKTIEWWCGVVGRKEKNVKDDGFERSAKGEKQQKKAGRRRRRMNE